MKLLRTAAADFRAIRPVRLLILLLTALAAGLLRDWAHEERVFLPRPAPNYTIVPAP